MAGRGFKKKKKKKNGLSQINDPPTHTHTQISTDTMLSTQYRFLGPALYNKPDWINKYY